MWAVPALRRSPLAPLLALALLLAAVVVVNLFLSTVAPAARPAQHVAAPAPALQTVQVPAGQPVAQPSAAAPGRPAAPPAAAAGQPASNPAAAPAAQQPAGQVAATPAPAGSSGSANPNYLQDAGSGTAAGQAATCGPMKCR
jgi:hypothetical protein